MVDLTHTLIIGVDGGGTGCRVAIGTHANGILAQAEGGAANAASDPDLAIKNIISTVEAGARKVGIATSQLEGAIVHAGLAGVLTSKISMQIASGLPYLDVIVTDDRPTAVLGALGGHDGFLLSVGTGAIVAASTSGTFRYVGGWGFHVADQGSGAWLGRAALERILLCHDGLAEHTNLTRDIFTKFDNDPNAIVSFSMSATPGDFGSMAPDVVSGAAAGDAWGREIMTQGAAYLTRGLRVLACQGGDVLCLTGGVGPHYAQYLPPEFIVGQINPRGSALDGAFQFAKSRTSIKQGVA